MERIEIFSIITVALFAIAGIVIGILALNKKDDTVDPTVKIEGVSQSLKDWLKSDDAKRIVNEKLNESETIQDLKKNTITTGKKYKQWFADGFFTSTTSFDNKI